LIKYSALPLMKSGMFGLAGAHIGLLADPLEDHAAYRDGWLKALGDNPKSF